MTDWADEGWPGLFTARLHRVSRGNARRVPFGQVWLGLAVCGAVCTPPHPSVVGRLSRCPRCFGKD